MKKIILFYFVLSFSFSMLSQVNSAEVELEKGSELLDYINLGDKGFIIKTGKQSAAYSKKLNWKVYYFNNDLNLIYSKPIEKEQLDTRSNNPILASKTGNYFYHEEFKIITSFGAGQGHFTQIKNDNSVKQFDIKYKDYKEFSIENSFVDDYFYNILCVKEEKTSKKEIKNKYILYRFDHDEFKRTELVLDLPEIIEEDNIVKTSWEFSDHDEKSIYMIRKDLNFESGNHMYYVAVLNKSDGKILNQFKLNFSISPKHIRPSNNNIEILGANYSSLKDFSIRTTSSDPKAISYFHHESRAFGNLKLDLEKRKAYVYGLYGDKEFKNLGSVYKGYYIQGYNFDGEKEFEVLKGLPESLAKESGFSLHNIPYQRLLFFKVFDEFLELSIDSKKQGYIIRFSTTGEYIKTIVSNPERKNKNEKPYKLFTELITFNGIEDFLKTRNPSMSALKIFKMGKDRDILYENQSDKLIFYSFPKQ